MILVGSRVLHVVQDAFLLFHSVAIHYGIPKPCLGSPITWHLAGGLAISGARPVMLGGIHHDKRIE